MTLKEAVTALERQIFIEAVIEKRMVASAIAKELDLSVQGVYNKLRRFDLLRDVQANLKRFKDDIRRKYE